MGGSSSKKAAKSSGGGGSELLNGKKESAAMVIQESIVKLSEPIVVEDVKDEVKESKTPSETDSITSEFTHITINEFTQLDLSELTLINTDLPTVVKPLDKRYRPDKLALLLNREIPPENELQKGGAGDRVMSEHQLRVQRSLQKLNVPDWYKNSTVARGHEGFLLRKDAATHGGTGARETTHQGWPGLGSKTTSLSSLGSTQSAAARSPTSHLLSPSPTPSPHVFTRWSTSRLNSGGTSTSTSPCNSTRSSFNYRQPYLGWRSQERLSRTPRTPAERLAAGILPAQPATPIQQQPQVPNLSEVRTSIKEVTSAIVHYVSGVRDGSAGDIAHPAGIANDESPSNRSPRWERESLSPRDQWSNISRSSSPRGSGRLCWVESSFVGSRPTETPQTPLALTNDKTLNNANLNGGDLYLDLNKTKQQQQQQYNNHHVNAKRTLF